jgi:hypothetical protein
MKKMLAGTVPSKPFIITVVVIWALYACLNLFAPASLALHTYKINLMQVNLLRGTIIVPLLAIWIAAAFAYIRIRNYAALVSSSPEGVGYYKISLGVGALIAGLIIPSIIGQISSYFPGNYTVESYTAIIRLYLSIVFNMLAFWNLFRGSQDLLRTMDAKEQRVYRIHYWTILVVALLSFVYAWAIFHNEFRTVSTDPLVRPTYYLPDWLIVPTIFIPYLLIWLWGGWAITNFRAYGRLVPGLVYRKALYSFMYGLTAIIILLISSQFITQISTVFTHSGLKLILMIVYALVLLIAAGYLFLARGAKQLTNIEEV